ncbi:hypothetical protein MSAN_00327800 [Mycena sanguinolenta]|uniref:Uncharacterized protein n=1 Tax=Mycena sanguinolenta TaxID=230812 RepID=A0A8H6ZBN5_9AGAR|nr:hypothetical protein MSAN_00327800 [Mycena sanguinolenta]
MDALNGPLRSEGGAECQWTMEANGRLSDYSGTAAGYARSYSTGSSPSSPDPPPPPSVPPLPSL